MENYNDNLKNLKKIIRSLFVLFLVIVLSEFTAVALGSGWVTLLGVVIVIASMIYFASSRKRDDSTNNW